MRHRLPNILTSLRIAAIPALAALATAHERDAFGLLLIACLLGDVGDGALARALGVESRLGALLDSVADTLLFFMTIAGTLVFFPEAVREHAIAFVMVPVAWLGENVAALVRYRRLSSFHTYLSRAAAVAMGTFVAVLFLWRMHEGLLHAAVALVMMATAEEFVLLLLLPAWTPDVRGVYWVWRGQQGRSR